MERINIYVINELYSSMYALHVQRVLASSFVGTSFKICLIPPFENGSAFALHVGSGYTQVGIFADRFHPFDICALMHKMLQVINEPPHPRVLLATTDLSSETERVDALPVNTPPRHVVEASAEDAITDYLAMAAGVPLVLIPNIVHTPRGVLSAYERLTQTLHQLASLRKHVPKAFVVVLEMSEVTAGERNALAWGCDLFVSFAGDETTQRLVRDPNVNKTELHVLRALLRLLPGNKLPSHVAKFGGRYRVTSPLFAEAFADRPRMSVQYADYCAQEIVNPVFYAIPRAYFDKYETFLTNALATLEKTFTDNERLLRVFFRGVGEGVPLDRVYISGRGATDGSFRDH